VPFARICKHVAAVDVSKKLLARIDTIINKNITIFENDVRTIQFENDSFSKAVLYFALQHFTERETILLFKSVYNWLKPAGLFYIGDILDIDKIFVFYRTPEWQIDYFDSILTQTSIGTWFNKTFLEKLASYIGFKKCEIIEQPSFQINSHYRFDVLLQK
jgi:ubiquinone/menaquinone biosynthesis C-methylase UbiE